MRIRTYEIKDMNGDIIESGYKGWWNNQIILTKLEPNPAGGINGNVLAKGGWCSPDKWLQPDESHTLSSTANRWALLLSEYLISTGDNSPEGVINAIARALEVLEDERLADLAKTITQETVIDPIVEQETIDPEVVEPEINTDPEVVI